MVSSSTSPVCRLNYTNQMFCTQITNSTSKSVPAPTKSRDSMKFSSFGFCFFSFFGAVAGAFARETIIFHRVEKRSNKQNLFLDLRCIARCFFGREKIWRPSAGGPESCESPIGEVKLFSCCCFILCIISGSCLIHFTWLKLESKENEFGGENHGNREGGTFSSLTGRRIV